MQKPKKKKSNLDLKPIRTSIRWARPRLPICCHHWTRHFPHPNFISFHHFFLTKFHFITRKRWNYKIQSGKNEFYEERLKRQTCFDVLPEIWKNETRFEGGNFCWPPHCLKRSSLKFIVFDKSLSAVWFDYFGAHACLSCSINGLHVNDYSFHSEI